MGVLNVKVDANSFEQWASQLSTTGLRNAIRRSLDGASTAARKVALKTIAADIGVPVSRIRDAVSKVKRTTQTNLSASFTTSRAKINLLATSGATVTRGSGASGSTYRLTGGGSSALHAQHAFLVHANGGTFIAIRKGKSRTPIRGVFAESPNQSMDDGAAGATAWRKAAEAELSQRLPREIQKQFYKETLSAASPPDSGD